jgi:DNA-binding winged helix-turn-helix (wHTH) protein/Flp pilus assembly protein TadD/predicted Ser/Thr protein kinase
MSEERHRGRSEPLLRAVFGAFELDVRAGELRKHGLKIRLQEQPFQVLLMLLERPGEVVLREEIRKKLWPNDTIVEFAPSINAAIQRLRDTLGDSADEPRYVETVARRGYRFIGELTREEPALEPPQPPTDDTFADPSDLTGHTISHYRVYEKLGHGGMGQVYRARDTKLGRDVALKVLPEEFAQDSDRMARFEREAQVLAALNHPNIAQIYGVEERALVMELVPGESLKGPLPLETALNYMGQIADALEAAHEKGIVHRDLKPANVKVTQQGVVKVLDFGLAMVMLGPKAALDDTENSPTLTATLSQAGVILGTAAYMSPEQARGKPVDKRADVWAFGVVLYEMLAGRQAFRGETITDVLAAVVTEEPDLTRVPAKVRRLLQTCFQKDPKQRLQAIGDWRLLLEDAPRAARQYGRSIALVALGVIAAAGAAYFLLRPRLPKLTERDTVVLADFTNTTGDPVFDGTLRQGLSAQLEQSPFLSLVSDQRIAQTVGLMAQPKDSRLTKELSREVCQRTASTATVEGSIASLGSQYVLGLNAVNCRNGDLLAQEQVTANGKEQVLKALGDAAAKLREKLGESLASVQKYNAPPENVTTPSLEALQAYGRGYQATLVKDDSAGALPFFQRAVSLDPNFAMAYAWLGTTYSNLGENVRASENMRKAYELRGRTSELEKLYISATYENLVTGNLEAAPAVFELMAQTYPRDYSPQVYLCVIYAELGEHEKALTAAQEALKVDPSSGLAYGNLAFAYVVLNRLDEAKATAQEAAAHNLDNPHIHLVLYLVDFLQHNTEAKEREAVDLMGKPGYEDQILYFESATAAHGGEFVRSRELTRRAADSAQRANQKEAAARYEAAAAFREALVGTTGLAKQEAQAALALASGKDVLAFSAIALGLAGDSAPAAQLASDLGKRFAEDTIVQLQYLPMIHSAIALRANDSGKATEALAAAAPYEMGTNLYPAFLRGEAYLTGKQAAAAVVEYQKILDHPGVVVNEPIGALAHLGLGRAYALAGDKTKAKTAYQDFLALWKNADPDIPILQQAKAEYAKLK